MALQSSWSIPQQRLLLVDDDQVLCSVLARAFERKGYSIAAAHDYDSALAAAEAQRPQFAVVDLKFPGGSGLSLIRGLVRVNTAVRIVMLTGYASIATAVEAVKLGAQQYLIKPANVDEIAVALAGHGQGQGAGAAAKSAKPLSVNRMQWEHIHRVLGENGSNISATARLLGMHRRTLQRKLSKRPSRD